MKLKLTGKNVGIAILVIEIFFFITAIFMAFWVWDDKTILWNDVIDRGVRDNYGGMCWQHQGLAAMTILFLISSAVLIFWDLVTIADDGRRPFQGVIDWFEDRDERLDTRRDNYNSIDETEDTEIENNEKMKKKITLKKAFWYAVLLVVVLYGIKLVRQTYKQSKTLYNTSKTYHHNYQQKVEEKQGFYDKLWKTYDQKQNIAKINKDIFIEITTIIMENRADGEGLMWKWVQENQQIPYAEYTKFYANLSDYITGQREGYFAIEKQCQVIARQNNVMIDTFPNNIYNRVLKLDEIKFKYGFLSDSTNKVFKSGLEYQ